MPVRVDTWILVLMNRIVVSPSSRQEFPSFTKFLLKIFLPKSMQLELVS